MRSYPLLPYMKSLDEHVFGASPGSPRIPSYKKWPPRTALVVGTFLILLGVASAISSLINPESLDHLAPAAALCVFGAVVIRGPKPPDKIRLLNVLAIFVFVPLVPFYLNLIAASVWGEGWWNVALETRTTLLAFATGSALILATVFFFISRSEVRDFRRQNLYQEIRDLIPYADENGTPYTYTERDDLIIEVEKRWARVRLPIARCRLLIAAGIVPEEATSAHTKALSDENLRTMAWLTSGGKDKKRQPFTL